MSFKCVGEGRRRGSWWGRVQGGRSHHHRRRCSKGCHRRTSRGSLRGMGVESRRGSSHGQGQPGGVLGFLSYLHRALWKWYDRALWKWYIYSYLHLLFTYVHIVSEARRKVRNGLHGNRRHGRKWHMIHRIHERQGHSSGHGLRLRLNRLRRSLLPRKGPTQSLRDRPPKVMRTRG